MGSSIKTVSHCAVWLVLISLVLLFSALACTHHPLRAWSGKPMEEFSTDRQQCYRQPVFESCMAARGWRESSVYAPDVVTPAKEAER